MIGGVRIEWKTQFTYLEVEINKDLAFGPHISQVALRAAKTVGNQSRLMQNVGGAQQNKIKPHAIVSIKLTLYAALAWMEG